VNGDKVTFDSVTLETLIDSPILCGQYTKEVPIGPAGGKHRVFLACDSEAGLDVPPETKLAWDKLVGEAGQLFGSRPYDSYTFLLALSDKVRVRGLEHHESSDNRLPELALTTPTIRNYAASLLPHEYAHSWCGKFRRPADMIVPDFQVAPKTRMLWVYEGLTNYLGWALTARCGLLSADESKNDLAVTAERMKNTRGRAWRSLEDTASTSHLLVDGRGSWGAWRRALDYYDEGTLLWLEADVIIRRETKGAKSLDDFCRAFFACPAGRPEVKGFTFDNLVATLGEVAPYDWKAHFTRRVMLPTTDAPLDGITLGGWGLGYSEKPSDTIKAREGISKGINLMSSLGMQLNAEGAIQDVIPEGPAAKAGVGPGMKLVAVNGRRFTPDLLRSAVAATKTGGKLDLLVENGDFFGNHVVNYHDGARYPKLDRNTSEPDLIAEVLMPRVPAEKKSTQAK
jgi:predicted metalloprotease with PDZ domain